MTSLNLVTYNIKGINNPNKRKKILGQLKKIHSGCRAGEGSTAVTSAFPKVINFGIYTNLGRQRFTKKSTLGAISDCRVCEDMLHGDER